MSAESAGIKYISGALSPRVIYDYFSSKFTEERADYLKDKDTDICVGMTFPRLSNVVGGWKYDMLIKVDEEDKVVGVIKFSLSAVESVLEISMDVLCSVRKGVGKELIDIMKAFVRQETTIKSIYLMPDNDGLIQYYESRGFRGDDRSMMWEPSYEGGRRKPKTKRRKTSKKRIRVNGTRRRR
jgi:hypothetical protein